VLPLVNMVRITPLRWPFAGREDATAVSDSERSSLRRGDGGRCAAKVEWLAVWVDDESLDVGVAGHELSSARGNGSGVQEVSTD
jgi:hypothetical protein